MNPVDLTVLGSSGSIGRQTLDVAAKAGDAVRVVALAVHGSVELLVEQARRFDVRYVAVGDESKRGDPALDGLPQGTTVLWGKQGVEQLAALNPVPEAGRVDVVLNALVGVAGLRASHAALVAGRRLALANKESLVVGGDLLMPLAAPGQLLPVDSEHSAIYQCLLGESPDEVAAIWVTASGGPFRGWTRERLAGVTADQALAHPTWNMGPKITIDSSTLMNKGLEVIEAHHLFACPYDRIRVAVHPQSCIHSMVEYRDGSVKAHLGATDMRIPIQFALSYPQRWEAPCEPLDFTKLGDLTFDAPDLETFRCLALAIEAGRAGGTAPAALNAANEVAVAAFLSRSCGYLDIERAVETVLDYHGSRGDGQKVESLEQLEEVDGWARAKAREVLGG